MHPVIKPIQSQKLISLTPSPLLPHSPGVSAWEARQHVSPYGLSLCHRGESILNKPSEGFLCDTFHFPSSKLRGKLACQEDEREQAAEESKREGNEKKKKRPNTYN